MTDGARAPREAEPRRARRARRRPNVRRRVAILVVLLAVVYQLATRREPVAELTAGRGAAARTAPGPFTPLADSVLPRLEPLLIDVAPWTGHDVPAAARPGATMRVYMTAYCLRGRTRSGTLVREGIIAADPRVFPLGRDVDLFIRGRHVGRFRVEDTGRHIKGPRIDIWKERCAEAITFGRRNGTAVLVPDSSATP